MWLLTVRFQISNRAPQRMRAIFLLAKTDGSHPLIHQPGILPGAQMVIWISSAGKREILHRALSPFELRQQTRFGITRDLELHRSAGLLLDDHRPSADVMTSHQRADLELDQIAAPQLAVDGQIKQRSVAHAALAVQEKPDCPDLTDLKTLAWRQLADRRSKPADLWRRGHVERYPFSFSFGQHRPIGERLRQPPRLQRPGRLAECPLPRTPSHDRL